MKSLLDNKKNISIHRSCNYCKQPNYVYLEKICYNENTFAIIEYKFNYNNSSRSADVALMENNIIKYIFEICYKNKTKEENRPEPWIEINATDLINQINSGEIIDKEGNINIKCTRDHKCNECIKYDKLINEKQRERQERQERQEVWYYKKKYMYVRNTKI
jgi:hypothetical protein